MDTLIEILKKYKSEIAPVMGTAYAKEDFCQISLSKASINQTMAQPKIIDYDVTTYDGLAQYVKDIKSFHKAKVAHGGYAEHRNIYTASEHFNNAAEDRCIHLGIDLWADAETPVYLPLNGHVHSFKYNDNILDYGATIITQHELEGMTFYLLFGHLSLNSLENRYKNEKILRGSPFAWLGNRNENGGWVPHLHLQLITDIANWEGDYPGVATQAECQNFLKICPTPEIFCGYL